MARSIVKATRAPGGWAVTVNVPNAYTDGSARLDTVYVSDDAIDGLRGSALLARVLALHTANPFRAIRGVDEPASSPKDALEAEMIGKYERWQRWKTTRVEAQARGVAAPVITSLQAAEDSSWTAYANAVLAWRAAT